MSSRQLLPFWLVVTSDSTVPNKILGLSKLAEHPGWHKVVTDQNKRAILAYTSFEKAEEYIRTNCGEPSRAIQIEASSDFIDTFNPLAEQGMDQIAFDAIDLTRNLTTIEISDALAYFRKILQRDVSPPIEYNAVSIE